MPYKYIFAVCLLWLTVSESESAKENHWAVLVAGSKEWYNYRHQADISHAYQVMLSHGIPAHHIITFMYDDVANSVQNPYPGQLFNGPDGPKGKDVYKGVKIDYRTRDVTPENFLAVIKGKKEKMSTVGSGRVLESGPDDHVFINFADHGAPGLIAFPDSFLYAYEFMDALKYMETKNMYKQMVVYIEACESGSMFKNLTDDMRIFATTAANATESSYACFFDKHIKNYLGDYYSVYWMMDSDSEKVNSETLETQFHIVKKEVNMSHPQQFGDMSISKEFVGQFQGSEDKLKKSNRYANWKIPADGVASEDVPIAVLYNRLNASIAEEKQEIMQELTNMMKIRQNIDDTMKKIVHEAVKNTDGVDAVGMMKTRYELTGFICYQPVLEHIHRKCFDMIKNDYALRQLFMIVNLCEAQVPAEDIMKAVDTVCI